MFNLLILIKYIIKYTNSLFILCYAIMVVIMYSKRNKNLGKWHITFQNKVGCTENQTFWTDQFQLKELLGNWTQMFSDKFKTKAENGKCIWQILISSCDILNKCATVFQILFFFFFSHFWFCVGWRILLHFHFSIGLAYWEIGLFYPNFSFLVNCHKITFAFDLCVLPFIILTFLFLLLI